MKSKTIQTQKQTDFYTIPSDWKLKELHEVATVIDPRPSHRAPKEVIDGFPYVGIRDISKDGQINIDSCRKVGEDAVLQQEKSFEINENSIGFGRNGTVGRIVPFRKKNFRYAISPHFAIINPTKEIDKKFLYAALNSKKFLNHVFSFITGTTRPTIGIQDLRKSLIVYPPLNEQKKIGEIFFNLNKKIQNLRKQNKILEETAQTIFKSWFVDFDGVTEWDDSELGKIPKGWSVEKLGNFISVERGLSYKGKFLSTSGIPLINLGNIEKNGGFIEQKIKHYTGEFKTKHVILSRDIVIANTDITQDRLVLGSPAIIPPLGSKEIIFTHHIFAVRNNSNLKNYFLYNLLKTQRYHENVISYATGTTVLAVHKEAVLYFQFALPDDYLINKFEKIASNLQESFFRNNLAIQILTKTRDILLPKLMSGEIRV